MRTTTIALIIFLTFSTNTANAELKITDPSEVCDYMKDFGLVTRGWNNFYGDDFFCVTYLKELGDSSSPTENANNFAFYVEGNSKAVSQVKLVLNVNNGGTAKAAHEELLKAAETLSMKATGEKLPKSLKDAIKIGKATNAKLGTAYVKVVRENFPTAKGYSVNILIK